MYIMISFSQMKKLEMHMLRLFDMGVCQIMANGSLPNSST